MFDLQYTCVQDYLDLIGDWKDPWPSPIIEKHEGFNVVRDDYLIYGSKIRFIDFMISSDKSVEEFVYAAPATGYAQISLTKVCTLYNKISTLFMAKRGLEKLHNYQVQAFTLGANIRWVPDGMKVVCEARAREYAMASKTRKLIPNGINVPSVLASVIKVAQNLPLKPKEIWSVGSSGTLSRGLQMAFPDAEVHLVQTGHVLSDSERGRAIIHTSPYKFDKAIKKNEAPPYPSAPTYDAKVWPFVKKFASKVALVWNVGA